MLNIRYTIHRLLLGTIWLLTTQARGQVVISEFMADNVTSPYVDEEDDREDWVELHNTNTTVTVSLNGWYLRDGGASWRFPLVTPVVNLAPGQRLRVWCSGKNRKSVADKLHTDFKLNRTGEYLGLIRTDGLTVEHEYAPTYPVQFPDRSYGISGSGSWQSLIGPGVGATNYTQTIKARVPSNTTQQAESWTSITYTDTSWTSKSIGLQGGLYKGIGFDTVGNRSYLVHSSGSVQTTPAMYNVGPSIHLRIPFTLSNPAQVQSLQLRVRYEDGFKAYLNGQQILSANAPTTLAHNSTASSDREDDQSEDDDLFALAGAQSFLVSGTNVLAIQGLNNSSANTYFLFTPTLEAKMPATGSPGVGYLQRPTLGLENTITVTTIGPSVTEVTQNPARPPAAANQAFRVEARIRPTINPLQTTTLRYVQLWDQAYGAENSLAMNDNGTNGDLVAMDGLYSALIPGSFMQTLTAGQMLRWRVEATDSAGNITREPAFVDPVNSEQYFGVIAQTPALGSNLPVLHWFSSTEAVYNTHGHTFQQAASNSKSGKFNSIYFQRPAEAAGQFYDHVKFNQHGQSTSGFGKKSQNVNFSADNPFLWKTTESRLGSFNLLSNYADKSKVRNALAWEFWNQTRHPSHFCEIVRVQQIIPSTVNSGTDSQFYGLWDMTEDGNGDFLRRWDLDPDGALYKCYNSLENATQTANNSSGVEKKTREYENFSDLSTLVTTLDPANSLDSRRQWVYDNVDIPSLVNLLAVSLFIRSNDFGHKNYYMYRDSNDSGEWTPLPWDQDLSFGHTYVAGPNYFDDDLDSARQLIPGATANNRLMRLVVNSTDFTGAPAFAAMYVRRLRTLMDTYLGPTSAPVSHFEDRLDSWQGLMDPNAGNFSSGTDDADRDYRKWGYWEDGSGTSFAHTTANAAYHFMREHGLRIKSSNPVPPYPGASPYSAYGTDPVHHTTLPAFLPGRRQYLYRTDASRPQLSSSLVIPAPMPVQNPLVLENVVFNPGGSTQDGEYFLIRNTGNEEIDISDWRLDGEVEYQFKPGTVIPGADTVISGGAGQSVVNQLVVAKKAKAFRSRATSPTSGEFRQVQGGYQGQLSARGGVIELWRPNDLRNLATSTYTLVTSNQYAGAPTAGQLGLRISELNYNPADPTAQELLSNANLDDDDFEFIELVNAGGTVLNLAGAQFNKGVGFLFPTILASTLAVGDRRLVVKNLTAFRIRYGTGLDALILGEYDGGLEDGGESLQIVDPQGEVILDFSYRDEWFPPTDGGGRSLVTRTEATAHNLFGKPSAWAISGEVSGTPGGDDAEYATVYAGWIWDHFSESEALLPPLVGAEANPDGDAFFNLAEFAFAGNPRATDFTLGNQTAFREIDGEDEFYGVSIRRVRLALDLNFTLECSSNLVDWAAFGALHATAPLGDGSETARFRGLASAAPQPCYLRIKVSQAP
jgi:hypothetical protein